jgi:CheY-like chemotaxis protein
MIMKTILLTEDNQDMIDLVELILRDSGYKLILAHDGIEAVNTCLEQQPDLVLMDLRMPNMDGFHATMILRDKGFTKPIVVLTGSESEQDRKRAKEVGCNEYILKTLEMSDLEDVIDRYLYKAEGFQ